MADSPYLKSMLSGFFLRATVGAEGERPAGGGADAAAGAVLELALTAAAGAR